MIARLAAALALALSLGGAPALAADRPLEASAITGFAPFAPPDAPILMGDGSEARLDGFPGQLVVATFWFTACPGCQIEMPRLEALRAQLEAEGEGRIRILPISIDGVAFREDEAAAAERVRAYYERRRLTGLPLALDVDGRNAGLLFGADPVGTPTSFLISPAGEVIAVIQGAEADWTAPESVAWLKRLAGS